MQGRRLEDGDDTLDLGSGYTAWWIGWHPDRSIPANAERYADVPDSDKAMLMVTCPHGEGGIPIEGQVPGEREGWKVESWEPLTLSPSILRTECGCHGFIRNGKWEAV